MRKLYKLITGFLLCLISLNTISQENNLIPFANTDGNKFFSITQETGFKQTNPGVSEIDKIESTCKADFEINPTPNSPLYKKFTAITGHSEQKKPVYICWKFGDGKDTCIQYTSSFTGPYPVVHYYQQPGSYEVCVRIVYDGGCEAKNCKLVVVEKPTECKIEFERTTTISSNNPLHVYYKAFPLNSNNKKPKQICWRFGDGKDTCIQYPENYTEAYILKHEYKIPGNYEVCTSVQYYDGCEAKSCRAILVSNPDECKADFERIPLTSTNDQLLTYYKALPWHNNNKKPKTICWKFGDGKDTCIQYAETYNDSYPVKHVYSRPGAYEVCVKIIYQGGCETYKCKVIQVGRVDECKADFERLPLSVTSSPRVVYYKALTAHNNNKKPKQICWIFGDGKDTCIEYSESFTGTYQVRHEYREGGSFNVCVKILYYGGCEAKNCKLITVAKPDECKADFERLPENVANHPLLAYFKALTAHNNNKKPKQICWKFGDGKDTCITYPENYTGTYIGRHEYKEAGTYEVCAKIMYYGGCEAYSCKKIIFSRPDECKADFERIPENTANHPLLAYFKALTAHNNNKKPKQICWKFGDGKDTCIEYPENYTGTYIGRHEYKEAGTYEVCVKILYYGGCEAYSCKKIIFTKPDECRIGFERIPTTSNNPLLAYYNALPWHNNNKKPKQICWKFGDGKDTCINYPENYVGPYIGRHEYKQAGTYEVCVSVVYYGGCESKKCDLIKIQGSDDCKVKIVELLSPVLPGLIKGFSVSYLSGTNKRPLRICWNFGDRRDTCIEINAATISSQLSVRHNYPAPGVYKVCVRVVFDGGCVAEACVETVVNPVSTSCGGYMTNTLVAPKTIKFKAFAVNNPNDPVVKYYWSFGDGSYADGNEVIHTYLVQKTYEVCLTMKTQSGCETKICNKVIVSENDKPLLYISPNPVVSTMHALFYSKFTETVSIKIVNTYGIIVRSYTRNAVTGSNNWDFDLGTLTPGTYMIYIQSQNQIISQLFIKT
jgi:PKD repeat protein